MVDIHCRWQQQEPDMFSQSPPHHPGRPLARVRGKKAKQRNRDPDVTRVSGGWTGSLASMARCHDIARRGSVGGGLGQWKILRSRRASPKAQSLTAQGSMSRHVTQGVVVEEPFLLDTRCCTTTAATPLSKGRGVCVKLDGFRTACSQLFEHN